MPLWLVFLSTTAVTQVQSPAVAQVQSPALAGLFFPSSTAVDSAQTHQQMWHKRYG